MCTTYSTKNRAVVFNHYAVKTLLVNHYGYCPCGPNRPDYSLRSRLYNPDPKYQCHEDLTCHTYDSIPKGTSCDGYKGPSPPYPLNPNMIPCYSNGPCFPPNENCCGDNENSCKPPRCARRRRKPPCCCQPQSSYRDLICSMEDCEPCPPPCVEPEQGDCESNGDSQDQCGNNNVNDGGYSVSLPQDACGQQVSYNCDPCGNVCRKVEACGDQISSERANGVVLEATRPCGGGCVTVTSAPDSCDPSCCPVPCCGPPMPIQPRPCKKPLLRCPLRTHNYCRCMSCSPNFWICGKPDCSCFHAGLCS